jgi:hypothetical protein
MDDATHAGLNYTQLSKAYTIFVANRTSDGEILEINLVRHGVDE